MGKTLSYREEMLYYTGTYTNIHSYPNKLTNKRIEQQEALNISSMDKCEDERAKKARQHTGTLSPRSSDKYSDSPSQGKLCRVHMWSTLPDHEAWL